MLIRLCVLGSFYLFYCSPIFSVSTGNVLLENNSLLSTPNTISEEIPSHSEYYRELKAIDSLILNKQFSAAIQALQTISESVLDLQKSIVQTFFPESFDSFTYNSNQESNAFQLSQSESFGVLLFRHYENKDRHSIDINVVFEDPSIVEYINIIKNPRLVKNLENTAITKINNHYRTLEKYIPQENYCERNIIINQTLIVNVVANGMEDKTVMDAFCSIIDFEGLESFLSSQQ